MRILVVLLGLVLLVLVVLGMVRLRYSCAGCLFYQILLGLKVRAIG